MLNDGIKIIQYITLNVVSLTKAFLKFLVQVSINILYSVLEMIPISRKQNFQAKNN